MKIFNRTLYVQKMKEKGLKHKDMIEKLGMCTESYFLKTKRKKIHFQQDEMIKIKDILKLSEEEFYKIFYTND